ncbi:MAG: inositol monophosphatase [Chloroflexi bacterium]|uniref:Inositol monophosphatase n=1 Tax=Candidatus Chlorohelix allophototropha TaxID=3003348 RepID=A0A8T7LVK1_9CHLR|nr:inositol monophosphatase [Chloroflexota bacterium]WJW67914.1 inositol monophosphatase [Chloroflexota bacterium L227-S17]
MIRDRAHLLEQIRELHRQIRAAVVAQTEAVALEQLSAVEGDDHAYEGDTIFAIDRVSEEKLVEFFERVVAPERPMLLIAEGLHDTGFGEGRLPLPRGITPEQAEVRIIVDPIDGTRCIMYQKRSAWVLTGVAPNLGEDTRLQDIEFAVQTELPLVKQHLCDELWAIRGDGYFAQRYNRLSGEVQPITLRPSHSATIRHGYAQVVRFFPGTRAELAAIDDEIVFAALGAPLPGKTHCFEDQYTSSAGQFYELLSGHDRFTADIRPLLEQVVLKKGFRLGICCHPYDVCTELIAREMGVIITDEYGQSLNPPLNVETDVSWVGYANAAIRAQIEPLLLKSLRDRGLI